MKILSLPKDVLAELVRYLADHETLEGLGGVLGPEFSLEDARTALRELAVQLREESQGERARGTVSIPRDFLSPEARKLLSALSSREEQNLLKAFGFLDH